MKRLVYVASFVVALSISSVIGFADNASTTATPSTTSVSTTETPVSEATTTSPNLDTNDPSYASLMANYTKLLDLRKQEAQLMESIKALSTANGETQKSVWQSIYAKLKEDRASLKDQITTSKSDLDTLLNQQKTLSTALTTAKKNKDTTQIQALTAQLADLATQIKAKREDIQNTKDTSKTAINADKSIVEKAKEANAKIKDLRSQMKTAQSDIHTLRVSKAKEWVAFGDSIIKAKTLSDASTHMTNIVSYKQQIIDNLTSILALKKQVGVLLSGVLGN